MSDPAAAFVVEVLSGMRAGQRLAAPVPCTLGRSPEATLHLPDAHLSQLHGRVQRADGALCFADRGSSNGSVHVRGEQRTRLGGDCDSVELWDGDELWLGDPAEPVRLRVRVDEPAPGEVVAARPVGVAGPLELLRAATGPGGLAAARPEQVATLHRHTLALGMHADLEAVLEAAARMVFELLPRATHLAVALAEPGGAFPVALSRTRAGERVPVPVSRTLVRRVVAERAGLLLADAAAELAGAGSAVRAGLASTLAVPLWTGADVRGVLQVDNRHAPGLFDLTDLELLTVAAGPIAFACENARLVARLRRAEQRLAGENRFLKEREEAATFAGIIGEGPAVGALSEAVEKVRDTRVPVLIQGETGTGKELVARALHYTSRRRDKLFVPQNCSAIPENLLESELFGHVRGAFTGADRDKKGLFELADGGTIFLDEVGELTATVQAKLLRVLQEGEIWPVGAPRPRTVDVRVVAATHRDLEQMVRDGAFRQDLFYRLHVFPVRTPALREHREDIPVLARHFLDRYARDFGRGLTGFAPEAMDRLIAYDWPGNVRELQNEIQRVLIHRTSGDLVLADDLSPRIRGTVGGGAGDLPEPGALKDMLEAAERLLLERALRAHGGNKTRAAEALGITREGLHKKLTRFGMSG